MIEWLQSKKFFWILKAFAAEITSVGSQAAEYTQRARESQEIVPESYYNKYSVIPNTFWTKPAICVLPFFSWERDKKLISTNLHSVSHGSQKHTSCTSTANWIALLIVPIFYMHFFFIRSQRITLSDLSDNLHIPKLVAFCHAWVNMSWVLTRSWKHEHTSSLIGDGLAGKCGIGVSAGELCLRLKSPFLPWHSKLFVALKAVILAAYLATRESSCNALDKLNWVDDLKKAQSA